MGIQCSFAGAQNLTPLKSEYLNITEHFTQRSLILRCPGCLLTFTFSQSLGTRAFVGAEPLARQPPQ